MSGPFVLELARERIDQLRAELSAIWTAAVFDDLAETRVLAAIRFWLDVQQKRGGLPEAAPPRELHPDGGRDEL